MLNYRVKYVNIQKIFNFFNTVSSVIDNFKFLVLIKSIIFFVFLAKAIAEINNVFPSGLFTTFDELYSFSSPTDDFYWSLESVFIFKNNGNIQLTPNFILFLPGMSFLFYLISLLPLPFMLVYSFIILLLFLYILNFSFNILSKSITFVNIIFFILIIYFLYSFFISDKWIFGLGILYSTTLGPILFSNAIILLYKSKNKFKTMSRLLPLFLFLFHLRFEYIFLILFLIFFVFMDLCRKKVLSISKALIIFTIIVILLFTPYTLFRYINFGLLNLQWTKVTDLHARAYFIPESKLIMYYPNSMWVIPANKNWPCDLDTDVCNLIYESQNSLGGPFTVPGKFSTFEIYQLVSIQILKNPIKFISQALIMLKKGFFSSQSDFNLTQNKYVSGLFFSFVFFFTLIKSFIHFKSQYNQLFICLICLNLFFILLNHMEARFLLLVKLLTIIRVVTDRNP